MSAETNIHFPERDITFRITAKGQETATRITDISHDVGLLGYELIAAQHVVYAQLICAGEVIESVTYGEMITQLSPKT
jgi:hypothetical protein